MSAVSSVDSGVVVGASCVEAVEGCTLTAPCVLAATGIDGGWIAGAAGVEVTATACGVGAVAAPLADAVAVAGAADDTVAERTLAVTLPEPAELVVDPGAGVVGAAWVAVTLGVVLADSGAIVLLFAAGVVATGVVGFAATTTGCELMIPPVTCGTSFPPVAVVIVGASGTPFAPCATVTVKGCVVAG